MATKTKTATLIRLEIEGVACALVLKPFEGGHAFEVFRNLAGRAALVAAGYVGGNRAECLDEVRRAAKALRWFS